MNRYLKLSKCKHDVDDDVIVESESDLNELRYLTTTRISITETL